MKVARNIILIALSLLILCSVALSRKAKTKTVKIWDDCKSLCKGNFDKPRIFKFKKFGVNDMNRKFICKCQGFIFSEYYIIDISWENQKFKPVQKHAIEPFLSEHYDEVIIKDDRRRRF